MAYVYRHIRLDTMQPFYIGFGSDNSEFYKRAYNKTKRNEYWKRIVEKSGYRVDILVDGLTRSDALEKEIEFIKIYGRVNINTGILCNLTDGGEGGLGSVRTPEQRAKLKGVIGMWMIGKKASEETKRKMSIRSSNISEETRKKLSVTSKGRKHSPESILKMKLVQQKPPMSDAIKQKLRDVHLNLSQEKRDRQNAGRHSFYISAFYVKTNEKIGDFKSVNKCAEYLKISASTVSRYINGISKNPLKFYFKVLNKT
jgi:hypothetical protein